MSNSTPLRKQLMKQRTALVGKIKRADAALDRLQGSVQSTRNVRLNAHLQLSEVEAALRELNGMKP